MLLCDVSWLPIIFSPFFSVYKLIEDFILNSNKRTTMFWTVVFTRWRAQCVLFTFSFPLSYSLWLFQYSVFRTFFEKSGILSVQCIILCRHDSMIRRSLARNTLWPSIVTYQNIMTPNHLYYILSTTNLF